MMVAILIPGSSYAGEVIAFGAEEAMIDGSLDLASDEEPSLSDTELPFSEPVLLEEAPIDEQVRADKFDRLEEDRTPFNSQVYWMPAQNLRNQSGDWSQSGEQVNISAPVSIAPEGENLWLATGTLEHVSISTPGILPDSGLPAPADLWKIEGGAMNIRQYDNGWESVAILTIGSASDRPFASVRDLTATAIVSLETPFGDRDAWNYSVFYSPTSQFPYPLPGVAYVWRPNDRLRANLGIPFSLRYLPTKTSSIDVNYFPLTNVTVVATQQLNEFWSLTGSYQVVNETYWLDERESRNELFYLFDQQLKVGLQRKLIRGLSVDISAGYVFDREVFQADGFSENRRDVVAIEPGAIFALQLNWKL